MGFWPQNVHTNPICTHKTVKNAENQPKIHQIYRFFLNFVCTKPFLCVQILPTFWRKLGQKVGKVATKCTHKPHLYTQKLTFFLKICVYIFIKVGRNPDLFIKTGQHVHTNHHVLSSFCVYKTRLYNMVKPSRNISL